MKINIRKEIAELSDEIYDNELFFYGDVQIVLVKKHLTLNFYCLVYLGI